MTDETAHPTSSFRLHPSSFPSGPHPNPLPEYRERGQEEYRARGQEEYRAGGQEEYRARGLEENAALRCQAKIRYNHQPQPARAWVSGEDQITVHFDEPQPAITPGQAVVLYDGDVVLGGGWIDRAMAWSE
jgi:hypothetical protein